MGLWIFFGGWDYNLIFGQFYAWYLGLGIFACENGEMLTNKPFWSQWQPRGVVSHDFPLINRKLATKWDDSSRNGYCMEQKKGTENCFFGPEMLWNWHSESIYNRVCVCVRDVILSCVCTSCEERNLRLNVRLPDAALGYWVAILGSPVNPLSLSFTFFVFNNFKNLAVRTSYKPMKYQLYLWF